jgi:hypothetical protein
MKWPFNPDGGRSLLDGAGRRIAFRQLMTRHRRAAGALRAGPAGGATLDRHVAALLAMTACAYSVFSPQHRMRITMTTAITEALPLRSRAHKVLV